MPRPLSRSLARRSWWWVFALFIATPALALALLGLDAIRAEDIERRQRLREQQLQITRLASAAIDTAIERQIAEAGKNVVAASTVAPPPPDHTSPVLFERDSRGVFAFPEQRVFIGETDGTAPAGWSVAVAPAVAALLDKAAAAAAQGRIREAAALYTRLRDVAAFRPYAELQALLLRPEAPASIASTADVQLTKSDIRSPSGIPLALVVSSLCEQMNPAARRQFGPFLHKTLRSLRQGVWWLTLEQRRAYDSELQRWLAASGFNAIAAGDARLDQLARTAEVIAEAWAATERLSSRVSVSGEGNGRLLIVWRRADGGTMSAAGVAIPWARADSLFERALGPLFNGQSFRAALVDRRGVLWGADTVSRTNIHSLESVPGWSLVFDDGPSPVDSSRDRLLNYARVLFPVVVLACGLLMTAWIRSREIVLGELQATFVSAVTHEFKSPLTGIRLLLERITSGRFAPGDGPDRYYQAIDAETARLESLVNRLLESQKLQSGQKEYVFEPISLQAIFNDVVERMRPQAEAKSIQLHAVLDPDAPLARLDGDSISDAMRNLVDNAIKYSAGGTTVEIGLQMTDDAIEFRVSDQGVGVDPADRQRIFEPFVRSRRGDAANVHGTGLGLSLVKATAAAHGGTVAVSNIPGGGSCFTLTIPRSTRAVEGGGETSPRAGSAHEQRVTARPTVGPDLGS